MLPDAPSHNCRCLLTVLGNPDTLNLGLTARGGWAVWLSCKGSPSITKRPLFSELWGPCWLGFLWAPPPAPTSEGLASLTSEGHPLFQIELLDTVALNLHRIDKDVQRCDRNYWYFTTPNLERLRDIMCRCHWGQTVGDVRTQAGPWFHLLYCLRSPCSLCSTPHPTASSVCLEHCPAAPHTPPYRKGLSDTYLFSLPVLHTKPWWPLFPSPSPLLKCLGDRGHW